MTLLTLTRWSSEMLTYLAALFLLAAAPLAAQEKNVEDYLPLAVGNSWTYRHSFVDGRQNTDGSYVNPSERGKTEFTISILRTEVIDGDTYYVFSDPISDLPVEIPDHFIGGKKLRWEGTQLMEHDGFSSFSIYHFDIPTSDVHVRYYPIQSTLGDTLVRAHSGLSSSRNFMRQSFSFEGYTGYLTEGGWDNGSGSWLRIVKFSEDYGLVYAGEAIRDGDYGIYVNRLYPSRAVIHTSQGPPSAPRNEDGLYQTSFEYDDYSCYRRGADLRYESIECNYPPTSTPQESWGSIKNGAK